VLLPLVLLASCGLPRPPPPPQASTPAPYKCLLHGEERQLVAELFFGRSRRARPPVSEAEWAAFARDAITPNFPDGFTVVDGEGQWRDPQTGRIERERSKVLLVAAPRSADLGPRLTALIEAYKDRFKEQSVGIITRDACAAF
jgi:hypothetical protein